MTSTRPPFIWLALHPEAPLTLATARAAITALATLSGQPRLVLEVTGREARVSWKLGARADQTSRAVRALEAHLGSLRATRLRQVAGTTRVADAAGVRLRGHKLVALNHATSEPTTRSLLGALSAARRGELVHVQLILGPRRSPGPIAEPPPRPWRQAVLTKQREHQVDCEIRIGASTPDPKRSRSLINGVADALRGLEVPGVHLRLVRVPLRAFDTARSPLLWPSRLGISDIVPLTGWPIGDLPLPGVPDAHPRLLPPSSAVPMRGRLLGAATSDPDRPVALKLDDSFRHLHLLGPTGVGKSTLMAHLALSDIAAGRSVVVIDPKGDLVDELLARIPEDRGDDVVVLDAADTSPVGINGLANPANPDQAADSLLAVFHSLYRDSWGPRTHDILHACLLTLARRGDGSLAMVPLLLTNPGFRRSVVGQAVKADPMGLGSFWSWFDGISEAERSQAIAPLMNKLRSVLLRPGVRGIFAQRAPRFQLSQVFSERRILLVSLAKGQLGPEASQLLGSVIVSLLWDETLRQLSRPADRRRPVMLHVDEVQDYLRLSGDLGDALVQARGARVGLTAAHQHLGQLPPSLRDALLANARSRIAFSLSGRDARDIAGLTHGDLTPEDFERLPAFQAYASLLVDNTSSRWLSLSTRPLGPPTSNPAALRARSRAQWGRPLDEIEAELLALTERPTRQAGGSDAIGRAPRTGAEQPPDSQEGGTP